MEQSNYADKSADFRSVLLTKLKDKQAQTKESSYEWTALQEKIDSIIAVRYLEYLNR